MALNGGFNTSPPYITSKGDNITFRFNFNVAQQSVSGNYSDIDWQLVLNRTSGHVYCGAFKVIVDGETFTRTDRLYMANGDIALSGTKRIYHNSDGSKKFNVFAEGAIYYNGVNTSGEETFTLNTIPRQADLTSAPNFNDEQNPTIKYHNPVGAGVSSLQACIASSDGKIIYAPYRDVSKTSGSYTFNLTETERNNLRKACSSKNSLSIEFALKTITQGKTYYSVLYRTLSIINSNPTITMVVKDVDNTTLGLTGDNQVMIKGYSNINITMTATAKKQATITSRRVKYSGGWHDYTKSFTVNNISDNYFQFYTKDSRGKTLYQEKTLKIINYSKPVCFIKCVPQIDADNQVSIDITITGNFFNGSFGKVNNSAIIEYRFGVKGGALNAWKQITPKVSGKNITATGREIGLSFDKAYEFEARIIDKLSTNYSSKVTVKANPVFEWGSNDFTVNVPLHTASSLIYTGTNSCGLNLHNSDVIGANGIYFNDYSQGRDEGLNFKRDDNSNYDSFKLQNGNAIIHANSSEAGYTKYVLVKQYTKGDTIKISQYFSGHLTAAACHIKGTVIVNIPIDTACKVKINNMSGIVRGVKGYLDSNSEIDFCKKPYSCYATVSSGGSLNLFIEKESAWSNSVNNTPINISLNGSITLY